MPLGACRLIQGSEEGAGPLLAYRASDAGREGPLIPPHDLALEQSPWETALVESYPSLTSSSAAVYPSDPSAVRMEEGRS